MLTPLGWLYGKIINKRNYLYKKGTFKSRSLGVPTFSIGNITVGGTGKTPLVAEITETLAERGEKICIISRGYKRENEKERVLVSDSKQIFANVKQAGDEPFELAYKLLGKAYVVADANRVEAGIWAKNEFGITAFVLDDAFQHLKVKRDLDIVTIDATNPFGNGKVLPAGILREPLENLKRTDLFVITRANLGNDIEKIKKLIKKYNKNASIISASNKIANLTKLQDFPTIKTNFQHLTSKNFFAFCALGNADNFFDQLIREKLQVYSTNKFKDHHYYNQNDIDELEKQASQINANAFITTAKDAVKLKDLNFRIPCYVVESELIFDDKKKLREMIHAVFD